MAEPLSAAAGVARRALEVVAAATMMFSSALADTTTPGSYEPALRENATFWIAVAGAVFGAVGTALGVYNTFASALARRIRVKVTPRLSYPTAYGTLSTTGLHPLSVPLDATEISFEIANLSAMAVTVDDVGFTFVGTKHRAVIRAQIRDGGLWPRRLEARETVEVFTGIRPTDPELGSVHRAYAALATGETFTGKSPILRFIGQTKRD